MEYTGERFIPGQVEGDIKIEHMHRYKCITKFIKDKIVLDAACGDGYGTDIIAGNAFKAYGIDISKEAIDVANRKYSKENLEFLVASVETLPFSNASIDVIVSFETIEHVDEEAQHKFLTEVKRVLKHDGIFIISTPDKRVYSDLPGYKNVYHQKEFYIDEFKDFLNNYFMYINMYSQSFKRINIINSMDNATESFQNIIVQDYIKNTLSTYVIAVCSRTEMKPVKNLQSLTYCNQSFQSSLYLDYGNGFSEEHKVIGTLQYNGVEFIVDFELPDMKLVKALRWDPLEGIFCSIRLGKIVLDNGTILVSSSNAAYKKEGFYVFITTDPMYEFEGEYHNAKRMLLEGKMEFVSSIELYNIIYNAIQDRDNITVIKDKLFCDLKKLEESHKTITEEKLRLQEKLKISIEENKRIQEYNSMITEDNAVLQSNYNNITKEMDKLLVNNNNIVEETLRLQGNCNSIFEKLQELQEKYDNVMNKYKLNEAQNATLQNNYDIMVEEKDNLQRVNNQLVFERNDCEKRFDVMRAETEKLRQTLDSILASKSWKLTKPFRRFKDFL